MKTLIVKYSEYIQRVRNMSEKRRRWRQLGAFLSITIPFVLIGYFFERMGSVVLMYISIFLGVMLALIVEGSMNPRSKESDR